MLKSLELLNHIKAHNAETRAWVAEDPQNRFASVMSEDPAYWADRGITTLEELERDDLIAYIYDGHKDAYGFRNRNYDFDSMSLEELRLESDRISAAVKDSMDEEKRMHDANIADLEKRISDNILMGASDRQTAIRWILEGEGLTHEYDVDYVNFSLGIPYGHMKEEFEIALKRVA